MKKAIIGLFALALMGSCKKDAKNDVKPVGSVKAYQETWAWDGKLYYSPYDVENLVWAGVNGSSQKTWANNASNWGVEATHPNGGSVKSYPNVNLNINKKFSSVNTLNSNFNFTAPSIGVWDVAFDVWFDNYNYEVMVWEQWKDCSPISYNYNSSGPVWAATGVNIGGILYNVARGHTDHDCISFVPVNQTNNGYADLKAIVQWIDNKSGWGYNFYNRTLSRVGYGIEFTSTNSQKAYYTSNSYTLRSN